MDNRLALVVDDSRTARETLKRMLEKHNLGVDTLDSAPAALDYLKQHTPDVIFMDHMMPGMDGFQAVEAIKGNPDTATIPIMMYTSKEGDLYVSQARALGAVGILPKQVEPAELFEVLNKLGLVRERRARPSTENRFVLLDPPQEVALSAAREQITEIADRAARAAAQSQQASPAHLAELLEKYHMEMLENLHELRSAQSPPVRKPGLLVPALVVAVMLVPLLWILQQGVATRAALEQANRRTEQLLASEPRQAGSQNTENDALRAQLTQYENRDRSQSQQVYDDLAWAINQGGAYDMNQDSFGDARLAVVQELVSRLHELGFRGIVQLESHLGEFCLTASGNDGLQLAAPDTPVTACDQIGHPQQQSPDAGARQSIAFANFLATSPLVNRGDIRIEIVPYLFSRPRIEYPPRQSDVSAADWNRVAAANNRIEVRLLPDGQ
jgi:CheY-like chemotaxis protein